MAITRAQQVKQMLREGGRIGFRGGDAAKAERARSPSGKNTSRADETGSVERDTGLERARQRNIETLKTFKEKRPKVEIPNLGLSGVFLNLFNKGVNSPIQKFADFTASKKRPFFEDVIRAGKIPGLNFGTVSDMTEEELEEAYQNYDRARLSGEIDAYGNPLSQGDGDGMSDYERRLLELEQATRALSSMNQEPGEEGGLRLAFRANGGRIGFRGGDAARSDAASGRNAGRADPSGGVERPGGGGGDGPSGPPTNVGGGGITTQISKKNIPTPNTDISKFNVKDLINLGLVDLEDENTQVAELFGEQKLKDIGAIEKGFFGNKLTDKGKVLEAFRNTATNFNKSTQNTANTPQAALNFMQNKPGLFSDVLDNQEFIQSAIDQGFLGNPNDYKNQKALDTFSTGGRAGLAEGGMMSPEGGIMDLESGRQMYFLGKLVKKATRAVKKIVKSPIGKAALLYAGTAGLGAFGAGAARAGTGFGIFSPTNVLSNLGASKALLTNKLFGDAVAPNMTKGGGIFSKALKLVRDNPFEAITAASLVAGLTAEQEDQAQQLADTTGIDIEAARNQILNAAKNQDDFRARAFKADGGIMRLGYQEGSKEPVAKKTMPLLDMGGKEMDLREDGGFVPIGRMEKADDVPARLSKNEFVFTADAVRNAGDGNVDKGAEVMYNMMKNLESGGDVSEESQGLEGARKMFQTSQRLEEVI